MRYIKDYAYLCTWPEYLKILNGKPLQIVVEIQRTATVLLTDHSQRQSQYFSSRKVQVTYYLN